MLVSGLACDGDLEDYLEDWAESTPTPTRCPLYSTGCGWAVECLDGPLGKYCLITLSGKITNNTYEDAHNVLVTLSASKPEEMVGTCSKFIGTIPAGATEEYEFICTSTGDPDVNGCTVTCD